MKIAIVTGGSRGLGRETVLSLAKERVSSIFTYHTRESEAHKVIAAVEAEGCKAIALQLNTGDTSSFDALSIAYEQRCQISAPHALTIS